MTTLPPFSQLIRHQTTENDEWYEHGSSPSTTQSPPGPPALHSQSRHLNKDSQGSSIYPSEKYQYSTRPIQIQPLTPRPHSRYRQQIPDAVIDPSLRELHTSITRGSYNEDRPRQYIEERNTFAQAFGAEKVLPLGRLDEPRRAYPQVVSQHCDRHQNTFCPSTEAPTTTTPPLIGVQIANKRDVRPTYEYDNEHYGMDRRSQYDGGQRGDYGGNKWYRHQRTSSPPGPHIGRPSSPINFEGYRYPPIRPHTPPNTTRSSATPSSCSPLSHGDPHPRIARPSDTLEVDEHRSHSDTHSHALLYPSPSKTFDGVSLEPPQEPNKMCTHRNDSLFDGRKREREEHRYGADTYGEYTNGSASADSAHDNLSDKFIARPSRSDTVAPGAAADSSASASKAATTRSEANTIESETEASVGMIEVRTTMTEASVTSKESSARKRNGGTKRGSLRRDWTGSEPPEPLPPLYDYRRANRSTKTKTGATRQPWRVHVGAAAGTQQQAESRVAVQDNKDTHSEPRGNFESLKSPRETRKVDNTGRTMKEGTRDEDNALLRPRPKPRKKQRLSLSTSADPPPPRSSTTPAPSVSLGIRLP